jgi:deoxyadenosine/deoxycytidine kinase
LNRHREAEKNVSFDYIAKINKHYDSFFPELREKYCTIDIDMNKNDFIENPSLINTLHQNLINHSWLEPNHPLPI